MLRHLFKRSNEPDSAHDLYSAVVRQSRLPVFYRRVAVPDSVDGRFELIAVHMFLLLNRLKAEHPRGAEIGQRLHDLFFADMDQSLREMGAGDLGVGKRVKRMAEGFYGRVAAYEAGLEGDSDVLIAALRRNLYGTIEDLDPEPLEAMERYLRAQQGCLAEQNFEDLLLGRVAFAAPGDIGENAES